MSVTNSSRPSSPFTREPSYSGSDGGQCVEVAPDPARLVAVRDSKNPSGPKLLFTSAQWWSFIAAVKSPS